mgnify:CR=1 FL=1
MYSLNRYFAVEPLLVLWFVRQNIQKVKLTLPIKWELQERNSMRHFIG